MKYLNICWLSLDKPENVKLLVNGSTVCKSDDIRITCSADGKPAVHTYRLYENEIPVSDGDSSAGVWTRKYLKEGKFSYRCVGNNAVGASEKIAYIAIKGRKFSLTFTERSVARIFQQGRVSHRVKLRLPS